MKEYDCIVMGGGPAGSCVASVLAGHNRSVLLIERDKFPRYHVGESMIPFTYEPLNRIGVIDKLKSSSFIKKYSVQFVSPTGNVSQPFYFFNRYDRDTIAQTWQVLRSEFDMMLLDNARERGVNVWEQCEVVRLLKNENNVYCGVSVKTEQNGELDVFANMIVDATGRSAISATANGWRRNDPFLNKVAIWTYYENVMRDDGIDGGATTIAFIPNKGWFWYIPQHNNRVSVGVVADGKYLTRDGYKDPESIFNREIEQNVWIKEHLSGGKVCDKHWLTSEYTFRSHYCADDGLILIGDAFGFLDPVFSSGLLIALKSGIIAGDAIHLALSKNDVSAKNFINYSDTIKRSIENMRKLIYAFYDTNVSFKTITEGNPHLSDMLTDCLSGDVDKDFSEMFNEFGKYTTIPHELPYGIVKQ